MRNKSLEKIMRKKNNSLWNKIKRELGWDFFKEKIIKDFEESILVPNATIDPFNDIPKYYNFYKS